MNEELINTYNIIKTDVERLIIELKQHKEYHFADSEKSDKPVETILITCLDNGSTPLCSTTNIYYYVFRFKKNGRSNK